jgi:DNA-binding MarR family transcriptional regulator
MAQIELLMALQDQPGRVGDLAARLRLAGNTVSTLVQQLVQAGFVHRSPDAMDRRAAVIGLTDAGRGQLADWDAAHQQRIGDALSELSPADRTAIQAALPALDNLVAELAGQRRP